MDKNFDAYKTIGEVAKILDLNSKNRKKISTYTLRFWEKEFYQIKPIILKGNRRYYDRKNIELLKKIHFLLKEQGMTIKGVKKILKNKDPLKLDEISNHPIKTNKIKNKLKNISNLLKKIKRIK